MARTLCPLQGIGEAAKGSQWDHVVELGQGGGRTGEDDGGVDAGQVAHDVLDLTGQAGDLLGNRGKLLYVGVAGSAALSRSRRGEGAAKALAKRLEAATRATAEDFHFD